VTNKAELSGAPTKRFFVSMLPRDIEMDDAILDLIDNSVDGAMRQRRKKLTAKMPYKGFHCRLTVDEEAFVLSDNCGGIPDAYLDAAFRLGRPSVDLDGNLPTIGMYGIGMKRAIFKMAKEAEVTSRSDDRAVKVVYTPDWLDPNSDNWLLPFEELPANTRRGVTINVTNLKAEVGKLFRKDSFLEALSEKIGQHFAYIIEKGFKIFLNDEEVQPETVHLIFSNQIKPYDYEAEIGKITIKVTVGFYRNLTRQAELEESVDPEESDARRPSVDEAGITVICNDRVVLISDTTAITGWGLSNVPRYHPQFRAISGLIIFYSEDAKQLPISTTKRDLDTDTDVFNQARNAAMEGLKLFTGFTNRWKGAEEETDSLLSTRRSVDARTISLAATEGRAVRGSGGAARKFVPELPVPQQGTKRRRIAFSRPSEEVETLAEMLLGDRTAKPSDVGVAAWEDVLNRSAR
jgi:hypothetical protein